MRSLPLVMALIVLAPGCARATLAALVPRLELRASVRWLAHERALTRAGEGGRAVFGAWLRWQPRIEARSVPTLYELAPAAWAAPCAEGDVDCFGELGELDAELAAALRELP